MKQLKDAASILGSAGGKSGFGASKRRPIEQYKRMARMFWDKNQKPLAERFWEKVKRGNESDCWPWTGCVNPKGYGCFNVNNRMRMAHRVAYIISIGNIPQGLCVLHHCDNPPCCNPKHLFVGTFRDNTIDMLNKGRSKHVCGSEHPRSKLTESEVAEIRTKYASGKWSHRTLGIEYGVSKPAICCIVTHRSWKHI